MTYKETFGPARKRTDAYAMRWSNLCSMKKSPTTTTGQFKKGSSGNPTGRPAGSRNKSTMACEELLEGQAEKLTQKAVEMALEGNVYAMRLCLERIIPARKERCITLESRPVESVKDLPLQFQDILRAVTEGRITPGEGESLFNILSGHARIMETAEFDRRLAELETNTEDVKAYRAELRQFLKDGGPGKIVEDRKDGLL
jgi:hypothetical protein